MLITSLVQTTFRVALFAFVVLVSPLTEAQNGDYFRIKIVTASAGAYGGCAAWLSPDPVDVLFPDSNCTRRWVTLDCEGQFTEQGSSKAVSAAVFGNAQLAMLTQKVAFVEIYSDLSDDGFCYARRVDVFDDSAVPPGVDPQG